MIYDIWKTMITTIRIITTSTYNNSNNRNGRAGVGISKFSIGDKYQLA